MPESRVRRKKKATTTAAEGAVAPTPISLDNPRWLAPAMIAFFLIGLLWIVVFYIAGSDVPVMKDLSNLANIGVGFGFLGVGFVLATRWR